MSNSEENIIKVTFIFTATWWWNLNRLSTLQIIRIRSNNLYASLTCQDLTFWQNWQYFTDVIIIQNVQNHEKLEIQLIDVGKVMNDLRINNLYCTLDTLNMQKSLPVNVEILHSRLLYVWIYKIIVWRSKI